MSNFFNNPALATIPSPKS